MNTPSKLRITLPNIINAPRLPDNLRTFIEDVWDKEPSPPARQAVDLPSAKWDHAFYGSSSCLVVSASNPDSVYTATGWHTLGTGFDISEEFKHDPDWIRHKGKMLYEFISDPVGPDTALPPQGHRLYISVTDNRNVNDDLSETKLILALEALNAVHDRHRHTISELQDAGLSFMQVDDGGLFANETGYWLRCRVLESKLTGNGGFHLLSEIESVRMTSLMGNCI